MHLVLGRTEKCTSVIVSKLYRSKNIEVSISAVKSDRQHFWRRSGYRFCGR